MTPLDTVIEAFENHCNLLHPEVYEALILAKQLREAGGWRLISELQDTHRDILATSPGEYIVNLTKEIRGWCSEGQFYGDNIALHFTHFMPTEIVGIADRAFLTTRFMK